MRCYVAVVAMLACVDAVVVFSREKVWKKMNDNERVLMKLIAKEICMQPTLVRCC